MPKPIPPALVALFASCAVLVTACGGGDDADAPAPTPPAPAVKGQCDVVYPEVKAGETFAVNVVTTTARSALAASGTGFPEGGRYDLRIAPADAAAADQAKQAMGAEVQGPLMKASWCVEQLTRTPTSSDTMLSYWGDTKGPNPITLFGNFPTPTPTYILEGFTVRSDWVANEQRVYFNLDTAKFPKVDVTKLGICRATVYGAGVFSATCHTPTVTPTATGYLVEALLVGEPKSGYAQVMLVATTPR